LHCGVLVLQYLWIIAFVFNMVRRYSNQTC
jgi:hypothetical protein